MGRIPDNEIQVDYARSSGPGGQNVNKRETKAVLHWPVGASAAFSDQEKDVIRDVLANRLNSNDQIVVWSEGERSQNQNREAAIERLQMLVSGALIPRKPRKATIVTRGEKRKRLESKRRTSEKKRLRRVARSDE